MLISVIVPVYNTERYLSTCIDSILSQTYTDIELLLVDDGSTDGSGKICDDYAARDNRIRVFHKENGGVSSARNLGLDQASGEYIHFVDSDDIILQGSYQYLAEVAHTYSPDVICFSFIRDVTDNASFIIDEGDYYCSIHGFAEHKYIMSPVCFKLFKRSYIEKKKVRFDSVIYCEDTIFTWNLLQTDGTLFNTKSKLYSYTTNVNSAVNRRDIAHIKETINSFIIVNNRLKEFSPKFLNCPPVISHFTHKYEVLFNRILCMPYSYRELKPLFARCSEIGISHLVKSREIRAYDFFYHYPFIYSIFQCLIRKIYFHRHRISSSHGDFIDGLIKEVTVQF